MSIFKSIRKCNFASIFFTNYLNINRKYHRCKHNTDIITLICIRNFVCNYAFIIFICFLHNFSIFNRRYYYLRHTKSFCCFCCKFLFCILSDNYSAGCFLRILAIEATIEIIMLIIIESNTTLICVVLHSYNINSHNIHTNSYNVHTFAFNPFRTFDQLFINLQSSIVFNFVTYNIFIQQNIFVTCN